MPNRLANAASPYLRMHADDPVDWLPWGAEAFETARELDRPVFLSCGYSACHWCHVMQRESFRDPETARVLNNGFVSVKVDRELRPDVDALYQDYVSATTGSGGWPLSVVLTPDALPLLGGTYFPKHPRPGLPSLLDVLGAARDAFTTDRRAVETTAAAALAFLREQSAPPREGPMDRGTVDAAADYLLNLADFEHGGLKGTPKFPQLPVIEFLCAYGTLEPDPDVLLMIETTMLSIVRGGIFDQCGGGVHRYATDEAWHRPHFEKMLPDQGLLLSALAAAAPLASSDAVRLEYARAAAQTAAFLRREMSLPGGVLAASLSAEAGGTEGAPYEWTRAEIESVLGPDGARLAETALGAEPAGSSRPFTLARSGPADDALDDVLVTLLAARQRKPQPDLDAKVLTSWNAMAARGLMDAGAAFDDPRTAVLGVDVAVALTDRAVADSGVLRESDDASVARVRLLEDAAHLVAALLSAYEVSGTVTLVERAEALHRDTIDRFADGTVLYAAPDAGDLPVRPRESGDAAWPSGASTATENALRLGLLLEDAGHLAFARAALGQFWAIADFAPEHAGRALAVAARLEAAGR